MSAGHVVETTRVVAARRAPWRAEVRLLLVISAVEIAPGDAAHIGRLVENGARRFGKGRRRPPC
jgi:uncharacterized protein with PIN domain